MTITHWLQNPSNSITLSIHLMPPNELKDVKVSCTVCLISNTGCLCMTLPDCCVMTVTIFCLYLPEALGLLLIYQKPVPGPGPGPVNTQFIVYSLQCTRLCSSITANIFTLLCLRSLCPLLFFKTRKNYMNFLKCLY